MRYFIGFLITIGLIILLIILLLSGGGNKNKTPTQQPLISYANSDAEVSVLVDGPVNAEQNHEQVRITVARDHVTYEKLSGYDGKITDSKTFANTGSSYDSFLHALQHAGFTLGVNTKALQDERGFCSSGNRYIYELAQDGSLIQRYWTSDCDKPKTYLGDQATTLGLFESQVPGWEELDKGQLSL